MQNVVAKATAAAKGPLHALRGSGEQEKMLKNAKTQYFNEHEEISTYLALETFATKVGDSETAKLARDIRRDEERMAKFLEGQIKALASAVAIEEVRGPAPRQLEAQSQTGPCAARKKRRNASKEASGKIAPKAGKARKKRRKTAPKGAGRGARVAVFGGFGSARGSSWISRSARGVPSSISRLRSSSALSWWPKRIARLEIQNQISSTISPPRVP